MRPLSNSVAIARCRRLLTSLDIELQQLFRGSHNIGLNQQLLALVPGHKQLELLGEALLFRLG